MAIEAFRVKRTKSDFEFRCDAQEILQSDTGSAGPLRFYNAGCINPTKNAASDCRQKLTFVP